MISEVNERNRRPVKLLMIINIREPCFKKKKGKEEVTPIARTILLFYKAAIFRSSKFKSRHEKLFSKMVEIFQSL